MVKQVIGHRIPSELARTLGRWDVVEKLQIESSVSQDLLKTRVMGNVNAVYTLECAHRRKLLAALVLNERSLLTRGLPFPHTKTIGDVYIHDLVILSILQLSGVY